MGSLISGLWGRLSGYNHRLRGIADRCRACVGGFIRVGLESVVIKALAAKGGDAMRSLMNTIWDGWSCFGNSPVALLVGGFVRFKEVAVRARKAMGSLIRDLWGRLSGYNRGWRGVADGCTACVGRVIRAGLESANGVYNHGLRGVADRGTAWVGGLIRVGLQSAVIELKKGEQTMRHSKNFFGGLRILTLNPLMAMGLVLAVVGMAGQADAQITFPDPNLEAALREALSKPEGAITDADLAGLTELDARGRGISDLTGMEHCVDLQSLNLGDSESTGNQISDLGPLSGLTKLTWLKLRDNQIRDISPLSGLVNLQQLWLSWNQIIGLGALSTLTNLKDLELGGNQISDLSPLSGLTNLTSLDLANNQISDLSPLSGLTNLTSLNLRVNQISDLSPLTGLSNLTLLYLDSNKISHLSLLRELTNVQRLGLAYNQISDIGPLANLMELWFLQLDNNQIQDISPCILCLAFWIFGVIF